MNDAPQNIPEIMEGLKQWFVNNKSSLDELGIRADISNVSEGSSKNAIHAHLQTSRCLATITVWETGESDFDMVAIESDPPDFEIKHYEFAAVQDLYSALSSFVGRL